MGLMSAAVKPALLTPEEYLAIEGAALEKGEFYRGVMYAMSGANFAHNRVVTQLIIEFGKALEGSSCYPVNSDQRIYVPASGLFTYPDVAVVCGPPEYAPFSPKETLVNPVVIAEVLSPSTEEYDRGAKFVHYQSIETLRDYLMLSRFEPLVAHYTKQPGGDWLPTVLGAADTIQLPSAGCSIPVAAIYKGLALGR